MTYDEALNYIHDPRYHGSRRGLDRVRELLRLAGDPHKKLKYVHVAGTNGKGSISACIAKILEMSGCKTGLYTSPYITRYNERMQINGNEVSDGDIATLTEFLAPLADSMEDHPSEFEFGTALAFLYFARENCDIVVLEVGMGGEFDATNVIDAPLVTVFAAIGLDHTQYLGETLPEIAATKGRIIKKGTQVVSFCQQTQVKAVLDGIAASEDTEITYLDKNDVTDMSLSLDGSRFKYKGEKYVLPLCGAYQPYNASTAIIAAKKLQNMGFNIDDGVIKSALAEVYWPGRFEVLSKKPVIIIDGAHNPHGVKAALEGTDALFPDRKIKFIMGVMADKDYSDMLEMLIPRAESFITLTPDNPRAMPADKLAEKIASMGGKARAFESIDGGIEYAVSHAKDGDIIVALGSLYFSSDVKRAFLKRIK